MEWGKLLEFLTILVVTYKGASKADSWAHLIVDAMDRNTKAVEELTRVKEAEVSNVRSDCSPN